VRACLARIGYSFQTSRFGGIVAGGVGTILVVLTVMAAWPQVLRLGPLHEPEELAPVGESA
jgi:hypothetical protein